MLFFGWSIHKYNMPKSSRRRCPDDPGRDHDPDPGRDHHIVSHASLYHAPHQRPSAVCGPARSIMRSATQRSIVFENVLVFQQAILRQLSLRIIPPPVRHIPSEVVKSIFFV